MDIRVCVCGLTALMSAGCAQTGFIQNPLSAQCASQAKSDSFIVTWRDRVPAEFASNKLGTSDSLVTRFAGVTKQAVEEQVLKQHLGEYVSAEYDYTLTAIRDEEEQMTPATTTSSAWGPQDIQASAAWAYLGEEGDGVTVAVIDSGVDIQHPLLQSQLLSGYNFADNTADVVDAIGHGTHVSGIIAGQYDPTTQFSGVAPHAKILPLKFMDTEAGGTISAAIASIEYAIGQHARVMNASWGGSGDGCSQALQSELNKASRAGIFIAVAAGNANENLSQFPEYPAACSVDGKMTVGSYNQEQTLSWFSNYGPIVDLVAPGEQILSTIPPNPGQPEGQMGFKDGTSMATPFVAGVAALLMAANSQATPDQVLAAIEQGVTSGAFDVKTNGKLNALGAAQHFMSHAP